jgi:hypothetical protein
MIPANTYNQKCDGRISLSAKGGVGAEIADFADPFHRGLSIPMKYSYNPSNIILPNQDAT